MVKLSFSSNISRRVDCPEMELAADNLASLFNSYFSQRLPVRDYILDNQGAVRKHIMIIIDGENLGRKLKLQSLPALVFL